MINFKPLPTLRKLQEVFTYDPSEGILRWKIQRGSRAKAMSSAGWRKSNGYYVVEFEGQNYYTHRIIWKLVTSEDIDGIEIDHIDGNTSNNKFNNLRLANRHENMHNMRKKKTNTSGFKGVYWNFAAEAWQAYITENGKSKYLGIYSTPEDAAEAVRAYREKLHKEFTNHG